MSEKLEELQAVIARLTGPDGCPWDREQTPLTLADYIIEESYELVAAIRDNDKQGVCEELGDVFFLLLLIIDNYDKNGAFSLDTVLEGIKNKMIRRHPHVFADTHFNNLSEQLEAWEKIKKQEHTLNGRPAGLFAGLPSNLPPLVKAYRVHSKAARVGFTWPDDEGAEQQVECEWLEWLDAAQSDDVEKQKHELGDIIFSLVEAGRRKGIKANEALDFAIRRFLRRFSRMEELAQAMGKDLADMDLDEQNALWDKAKGEEHVTE